MKMIFVFLSTILFSAVAVDDPFLATLAGHLESIASAAPTWGLILVFVFMAIESSFIPF